MVCKYKQSARTSFDYSECLKGTLKKLYGGGVNQ